MSHNQIHRDRCLEAPRGVAFVAAEILLVLISRYPGSRAPGSGERASGLPEGPPAHWRTTFEHAPGTTSC